RGRSGYDERRARYEDWRRGRDREREDWTRRREAERGDAALRRTRGGPFGAVVEKLVRGCGAQGAEFENWPFDAIAQIVGADEKERNALAALRESAKTAAQRLAADCPQDVPAAPAARLEAAEPGVDGAAKSLGRGRAGARDLLRHAQRRAEGTALPRHGGAGRGRCACDHARPRGAGGAARAPRIFIAPGAVARLRRRARGRPAPAPPEPTPHATRPSRAERRHV